MIFTEGISRSRPSVFEASESENSKTPSTVICRWFNKCKVLLRPSSVDRKEKSCVFKSILTSNHKLALVPKSWSFIMQRYGVRNIMAGVIVCFGGSQIDEQTHLVWHYCPCFTNKLAKLLLTNYLFHSKQYIEKVGQWFCHYARIYNIFKFCTDAKITIRLIIFKNRKINVYSFPSSSAECLHLLCNALNNGYCREMATSQQTSKEFMLLLLLFISMRYTSSQKWGL